MPQQPGTEPDAIPGPPLKMRRPWFPFVVLVLAAAAFGALYWIETSEQMAPVHARLEAAMTPFLIRFIIVGSTGIVLFLWFVFFAPLARAARLRVGAAVIAAIVVLGGLFRIEGVSGDIVPKLRFRWAPHADEALPQVAGAGNAASAVDLSATTSDDYPQFLGPDRRATLGDIHLARDWSARPPRLLWRQPIGAAWSSFAVVGHFGVTQEQRGQEELITCYDIDTGKLQWAHATPGRFSETIAGVGPRATPTIHGGRVYALGAVGDFYCLDGATGKPLWQHQIVQENGAAVPQWGKSCSPLVYDNIVVVSAGGRDSKSLVAYDCQTGELAWSAGDDSSSYSSPVPMTLAGQPQIVIVGGREVTSHDPADGHILWRHAWPGGEDAKPNVAQPIAVGDDRILLSKGYGVGSALWQIARGADGWSVEPLWKSRNLKTKFTNAVVRDGCAYGLDEGILSCVDIANGAKLWKQGKYGHGQLLLAGDRLVVQSERGEVALVEATSEGYHELARFAAVDGQSWNCPVLSGRRLLVRSDEEAACYELPVDESPGS